MKIRKAVFKKDSSFIKKGVNMNIENMSKINLKNVSSQQSSVIIPELVLQLGIICTQVYIKLDEKFNQNKHKNKNSFLENIDS